MRKSLLIVLLLFAAIKLPAIEVPVERIYVSTDREVYIAGDRVLCSLFCVDAQGKLSDQSAVSYLELISSDGTVAEAKVGLLEGRGAGSFRIPTTVPTGVYRLVSYTSVNAGEDGTPWMSGSKVLSIFNTLSTSRVRGGVDVVSEDAYEKLGRTSPEDCGKMVFNAPARVRKGADVGVFINNEGPEASLSFSVYYEDGIVPAPGGSGIAGFLEDVKYSGSPAISSSRLPEYDGEIISARVSGHVTDYTDISFTTLSSAGSPSNLYIGTTEGDRVRFMTNNIYGDREIVCQVASLDADDAVIEFNNPFFYPSAGDLPKLALCKSQYADLAARKAALRDCGKMGLDTLSTLLRHREDLLLESAPSLRYHLDDYTRFPSVKEVLVEIIPTLSLHREKGKYEMRLVVTDGTGSYHTQVGNLLVMMDGVVLPDLAPLLEFDAMLLEDVDVYQQAIVCGKASFSGLVNFITKKNYVTALSFPKNVRVLDFKGVSYPVAYYGTLPAGSDDTRQLLYWDPALKIEAGGHKRLTFRTPGYSGTFRAVAEGVAKDGTPIHHEWTFEVE